MSRTILLTGASGFVGSLLQPVLIANGHRIVTASRAGGVRTVTFDPASGLLDWPHDLPAIDTIVHLGDGLKQLETVKGDARALQQTMVASSLALVRRGISAGVRLIVHVSSIKAIAGEMHPEPLTEATTPNPRGAYGESKLALERALQQSLAGTSCDLVIVRNPLTYGAGTTGSLDRLLRLLDTGMPIPHAGARVCRSLLGGDNFVDCLSVVLDQPKPRAGTYHVHDGAPLSVGEIMSILRDGLGRPRRLAAMPAQCWQALAAIPALQPTVHRLAGPLVLDDALFRATFGWDAARATRDGLLATARAFRQRAQNS
jgi:nucleoside-diphosphate-sugar epimerase